MLLPAVADYRLSALLHRDALRVAALAEYSQVTGISIDRVMEMLAPFFDEGLLALEIVDNQAFVHTAPQGRVRSFTPAPLAPNLWEYLRENATPEEAFAHFQLVRALERVGWRVEVRPYALRAALGPLAHPPRVGVVVGQSVVPVLDRPDVEDLADPAGVLDDYASAHARAVALTAPPGQLEPRVTAVRHHFLSRPSVLPLSVLVLEEPSYAPTLVSGLDPALPARSVSRQSLDAEI